MTVQRNRITCDGDHAPPLELIVPDVSVRFVLPARVRTYAHAREWTTRRGSDYCSECSRPTP